jgi:CHAT domain-containing protein
MSSHFITKSAYCLLFLLTSNLLAFSQDKDSVLLHLNNPAHIDCIKCRYKDSAIYFLNQQDFIKVADVLEKSWKIKSDSDWFTPIYLAKSRWQIGNDQDIAELLIYGLNIFKRNEDTNSLGYVMPLFLLGNYYQLEEKNLAKALGIFIRVARIREINDFVYDPEYFICKKSIADIFRKSGMRDTAAIIYQDLVSKFINVDFENKKNLYYVPYVCPVLESIADMYKEDGRFNLSESYYLQCLSLIKKAYGIDDETYLNAKSGLAFLYLEMGETQKTKQTFLECLDITKTLYGVSNRRYLNFQVDLSLCYMNDSLEKARDLLKSTLLTQIQILGSKDEDYLSTFQMFSKVDSLINDYHNEFFRGWHNELDLDYISALRHYNKAKYNLENKKLLDSNYIKVLINIGNCFQNIGKIDSSIITFYQALSVEKRNLNFGVNSHYFFIVGKILELSTVKKENDRILTICNDEMSFIENKFGVQNEIYLSLLMHYVDYRFLFGKEDNEELLNKAIDIFNVSKYEKLKFHDSFLPKYSYPTLLCKLGRCIQQRKDFGFADSLYSRAIADYKKSGEDTSYECIDCIADKARLYKELGKYKVSSELYLTAYNLAQNNKDTSLSLAKFLSLVKVLSGLADLSIEKGNDQAALSYFSKISNAFNAAPQYKSNIGYPVFLNNLANTFEKIGRIDSAKQTFLFAKQIEDSIFSKSEWLLNTLLNLSNLYRNINQIDSAEFYSVQALNLGRQLFPTKTLHYARIIACLGSVYFKEGKIKEAIEASLEAVELKQKFLAEDNFELANEFVSLGCLYVFNHRYDSSCYFLEKALKIHSLIYQNNFAHLSYTDQLNFSQKNQDNYRAIKSLCFTLLIDTTIRLQINRAKFISLLYFNELSYKNLSSRKGFDLTTVADIAGKLQDEDVIIEFVDDEKGDDLGFGSLLLTHKSKTPEFLFNFWTERKSRDSLLSQVIYDTHSNIEYLNYYLTSQIEPLCKGKKNIFISPSNLLYQINFSAIPIDSSKTFGEKYNVHILNSTADVINCHPRYLHSNTLKQAIVYGGIDYDNSKQDPSNNAIERNYTGYPQVAELASRSAIAKFDYLPGTKDEAKNIQQLCKSNSVTPISFSGETATEASFKQLSGKKETFILHIATHGYFFPDPTRSKQEKTLQNFSSEYKNVFKWSDDPLLRSGLIFAGANHTWGKAAHVSDSAEDGILTSYEISKLDLNKCQLVVLSGCETGLGDIKGSEGVFGLQRAFKMAGVKNIIMSLWKVPDKETQELMTLFYNYCFAGKSVHDALQSAQSDMKKKGYAPYYWAAWKLLE